ncbi:MAG: hypothetical protein ACJA01_004221 [Saprospiraceae bacterium]|jgi:hypothetical protein
MKQSKVSQWLGNTNSKLFSIWVIVAAFSTYFCMYAFRKPITVGSYEGVFFLGMGLKTVLIISQTIGYTLSKFAGIKFISEMRGGYRALAILSLIGVAEFALLGFATVPVSLKGACLFFNGLMLGMIWGLVFSFIEGRKTTELLGAGLSVSFVVASGWTKSAGIKIMELGVPEYWMPFATGLAFTLPLIFFVWMLSQIPPPSAEDEAERTKREPMDFTTRLKFFKTFALGLVLLVIVYMFLTAFRDFRDNFMPDILKEQGVVDVLDFGMIETYVALSLLGIVAGTMLIKNHMLAFIINHILIIVGFLTVGVATWLFQSEHISANIWMVLTGIGGYMGYIPFNCILFERLIATFKCVSNAGFLIYVADAFGYLAAVGIMFYQAFFTSTTTWTGFFIQISWIMVVLGVILTCGSLAYFINKKRTSIDGNNLGLRIK